MAQFINILPYRSDSINAPSEVLEEPSQAEDSEDKTQEPASKPPSKGELRKKEEPEEQ